MGQTKIQSEMAGTLLEVSVKVGDSVTAGQEVAIVESMKMEVPITVTIAGTVQAVHKSVGDFLNEGETLLEIS